MTVLHTGSNKKFAAGWEQIFGNKRSGRSATAKSSSQAAKVAKAKTKSAKKKTSTTKKRK